MNPNSLSYPFPLPLPLSFARSCESKGCPNSRFNRGVGVRGRYPLKPIIFASATVCVFGICGIVSCVLLSSPSRYFLVFGCPMMWCRFIIGGSDEAGSL